MYEYDKVCHDGRGLTVLDACKRMYCRVCEQESRRWHGLLMIRGDISSCSCVQMHGRNAAYDGMVVFRVPSRDSLGWGGQHDSPPVYVLIHHREAVRRGMTHAYLRMYSGRKEGACHS